MATIIDGTAAAETLIGSEEADIITTNGGFDIVFGFGGDDTLVQKGGTSSLSGGQGNDSYVVLDGIIAISELAGGGIDILRTFVTMTADLADGVENIQNINIGGALTLRGNGLDNMIQCGQGADTVFGRDGNDVIIGATGNASFLHGEGGNDHLIGGSHANDLLDGGAGDDLLEGNAGPDNLDGGDGNDTYILGADTGDTITDSSGLDTIVSAITRSLDSFLVIEDLVLSEGVAADAYGNDLANTLTGNAAANVLSGIGGGDNLIGGLGADSLYGGVGNDTLVGGIGIDRLTGGPNNDFFVFDTPLAAANRDIITDFNHVHDTIRLENAVMKALGGTGALKAGLFFAGHAAHDANDHVIYNKATGALYYDANGSAHGGVTLLAILSGKPLLLANDFAVI